MTMLEHTIERRKHAEAVEAMRKASGAGYSPPS
jgi:hypothetical protein